MWFNKTNFESRNLRPVLRIRIRIKFATWIRIRLRDADPDTAIVLKYWRQKPKFTMISEVFRDSSIQIVKVLNQKKGCNTL